MADYQIRTATLDDTQAICKLARSRIGAWQRMAPSGTVQNVTYTDLSIYERWLHGGPWMTVETGALQMNRLLHGRGLPWVALDGEQVVGYTEVYGGHEPQPYGRHLHLGEMTIAKGHVEARDALVRAILAYAHEHRFKRVTANCVSHDEETIGFYEAHGLLQIEEVRRMMISARQGQVFYKATDSDSDDPAQINGWFMHIGRLGSARYQWEALWHDTWDVIPQIRERQTHRLVFNAAGNDALVLVRRQLYVPRYADVFCWTPKPPTGQLITAIRDWAYLNGYRKLVLATVESGVKTLGLDAEPDGYREVVYAVDIA
jgi:hypothetical protein